MFDDDRPAGKPKAHVLGEDLALLSVEEIRERIEACRREIERLEAELKAKQASIAAASSVFKI